MIILFEVNEKNFINLGLGVLTDAIGCIVKEKLNDEFTMQMEYPVTGKHFSKIQNNRILYCKPNPYDQPQAFRIYSITKPIDGRVVVSAVHLSYDLNNIPLNAVSGDNIQDLLIKIQNGSVIQHDFKFNSEVTSAKTFKTTSPYNLRAILMGGENSIVSEYDAELKFNNFIISIMPKRGKSSGAVIRYGHNMTDINHEVSTELLYNGVFPFYHTETEKNETSTTEDFTQAYIVGSKPLQDGWLSYSKDGAPYHPIDTSPIQIGTEGDYYQKVYVWNDIYHVYQEKLYNQTVTVLQGILEPEWITIDWSNFPNIICKASKKGYFKLATDENWGSIKGVGDTIFEGSIASSGIMNNMILYYSEVIPSKSESTNTDVTEIVDVQLDNKILWLDTIDAKAMKYNKVLMLDLTSEFKEEPTKDRLQAKAEEFINKKKIGLIKHTTTVSFIDLSATTEKNKYENFDHIEVGDTVKIIYEDANISVDLRVISTEYDVISKRYSSIELGEKKDTMSSESVQSGDNVSSLTNDVGYATITTVNKLIADMVTANYIEAINAKLTKAQISQLEVERINAKGIIEASQFVIDSLVAKLLVAEDANISNVLTAGTIKVSGDITIKSGQITISSEEKETKFIVTREGNLTANSVEITGGTLNINDGVFEVTNEGIMTAKDAIIRGHIEAITGEIGGFKIAAKQLYTNELGTGVFVSPGSTDTADIAGSGLISGWAFVASNKFGVTNQGKLYTNDIVITDGMISLGYIPETDPKEYNFTVDSDGKVSIKSGSINLGYDNNAHKYAFTVDDDGSAILSDLSILGGKIKIDSVPTYNLKLLTANTYIAYRYYYLDAGEYVLSKGEFVSDRDYYELITGSYFNVDNDGNVTSNSVTITGGDLIIGDGLFSVTNAGVMSASEAYISGTVHIDDGEIMLGVDTWSYELVNLDASTYRANIYYYELETEVYVLDTKLSFTPDRTYYKFVPIDSGVYNAKFYVDHSGNMYAASAHIQGEVNITEGSIKLGLIYGSDPAAYAFEVSEEGDVHITEGSIKLGLISGSNPEAYAFEVSEEGEVYISSGSIRLGDPNAEDGTGVYIDSDGNILVGYNSDTENYNFRITNNGSISIGGMAFTVDSFGELNIYNGSIGIGPDKQIYLGNCDIDQISDCQAANISNIQASYIDARISIRTYDQYIINNLYFGSSESVKLRVANDSTEEHTQENVEFEVYKVTTYITASGSVSVRVKPKSVTTMANASVMVKISYTTEYSNLPPPDSIRHGYKTITVIIPSGTTVYQYAYGYSYFSFPANANQVTTIDTVEIIYGKIQDLVYYINTSDMLQLTGGFIPLSYSNADYTLGMASMPWNKIYTYNGLQISKNIASQMLDNYINIGFGDWVKYEPSSTDSLFRIGQSTKTDAIGNYSNYYDESLFEICSQGEMRIRAYGTESSIHGRVLIQSYRSEIDLEAAKYVSIKMFNKWWNLNRKGVFIDTSTSQSGTSTLVDRTSNYWAASEYNDTGGPWGFQVFWVSSIPSDSYWTMTLGGTDRHVYGVNFQEYGTYAGSGDRYNQTFCTITDDGNGGTLNKIRVYNDSGRTISGWCWVLLCYSH